MPRLNKILIILLFLLAAYFRFYQLTVVPEGLTWDEAAIIIDSWSISENGVDQWGEHWPAVFKSLGDGKLPLTHYLLAATFKLFGFNPDLLRILAAVFGLSICAAVYCISRKITPDQSIIPLGSLIAVSLLPWSIHFSRFGLEAVIATAIFCWGMYALMAKNMFLRIFGSILVGLAAITYHSYLIISSTFLISWLTYKAKNKQIQLIEFIASLTLYVLVIFPIVLANFQSGWTRASQTVFFLTPEIKQHQQSIESELLKRLVAHINPVNWVAIKQHNLRQYVPHYFITPIWFLAMVMIGFKRAPRFTLFWLLVSIIPSLIGNPYPHTIRLFGIVPPLSLIAGYGFNAAAKSKVILWLTAAIIIIQTAMFWHTYQSEYKTASAADFQAGYKEMYTVLSQQKNVETFIVSDVYQHPYLYALLYLKISPKDYRSGGLANFRFNQIRDTDLSFDGKTVFAGSSQEIPSSHPHVIYSSQFWVIAR